MESLFKALIKTWSVSCKFLYTVHNFSYFPSYYFIQLNLHFKHVLFLCRSLFLFSEGRIVATMSTEMSFGDCLSLYSWDGTSPKLLKNGHVLFLLVSQNNNKAAAADILTKFLSPNKPMDYKKNYKVLHARIKIINEKVQVFKRHLKYNWDSLIAYLGAQFIVPSIEKRENAPLVEVSSPSPKKARLTAACHDVQTVALAVPARVPAAVPAQFKTIQALKFKLKQAKNDIKELRSNQKIKRINQQLKRKNAMALKYKLLWRVCKSENASLLKKIKVISSENSTLKESILLQQGEMAKERKSLKKEIRTVQSSQQRQLIQLKKAKEEVEHLTEKCTEAEASRQNVVVTNNCSKSKSYDAHTRKCFYYCLENQVPIDRAGDLVDYIVREFTETTLPRIPVPSTIAQMAYEMGVISDLLIAEKLCTAAEVATIAWDATTIDGCHYNEINISFNNNTYTLEIGKLAGGKTQDFSQHLIENLHKLASLYSLFSKLPYDLVLEKLRQIFQCTLSDRAPVNSCVTEELSRMLSTALVKLHCNLHPLDGLATVAKKILKAFDDLCGPSQVFGSEGKAANLIHAVSKLRYKMKSGDPGGFKTFLKLSNINIGVISRYVGNRLNILFHLAGIIVQLKDVLLCYLEKHCKDNPVRMAIIQDLQQPVILTQLRALGLFGKLLTGPWMTLFYKNEQKKKHLDMVPVMKDSVDHLIEVETNPSGLLGKTVDFFGNDLSNGDCVLVALRDGAADELFLKIVKALAEGFRKVLQRQLKEYLEGEFSEPSPDLMFKTSAAPLHNMHSERALGMFDAHCFRSKNATAGFMDGKIKFKLNNVMSWLSQKDFQEQKEIISFAIRHGAARRSALHEREQRIHQTATLRQRQVGQKRDMKVRRELERTVKENRSLNSVEGLSPELRGLCQSLLESAGSFLGRTLHHLWDSEDGDKEFVGILKKADHTHLWIQYHGEEKVTKLSLFALFADIILGDAIFVD